MFVKIKEAIEVINKRPRLPVVGDKVLRKGYQPDVILAGTHGTVGYLNDYTKTIGISWKISANTIRTFYQIFSFKDFDKLIDII